MSYNTDLEAPGPPLCNIDVHIENIVSGPGRILSTEKNSSGNNSKVVLL